MNCRRAQQAISERMDGEHLSSRVGRALDRHLATCPRCSAFVRSAGRVRGSVRIGPAIEVPDLVGPIMAAVAREAVGRGPTSAPARPAAREPRLRPLPDRPSSPRPPRWPRLARALAPMAASLVVGAIVGSVVVGGPWRRPAERTVAIADVTRGVATAARSLDAYRARFRLTEWNYAPEVPVRDLAISVWFRAPERFRLDVADHTSYPGRDFTPNDLSLVVNRTRWALVQPSACPPGVSCPATRSVVRNRAPFSTSTPVPTDLMIPVDTLAGGHGVSVLGEETVGGRPAVKVELPFQRATPLFPFLQAGGSWRPFFSSDRVLLWLDSSSWFPLRAEVRASGAPAREGWELRFGLPDERAGDVLLEMEAISVNERPPAHGTFRVPAEKGAADEGATPVPLDRVSVETGLDLPADLGGLELYRAAESRLADGGARQTIVTYTEGLTWLKIGRVQGWDRDEPYGPVSGRAEEIALPGGGVGYYEPATDGLGRRVAVHTDEAEMYIETNLPREQLVSILTALPVQGEPFPRSWHTERSGGAVIERIAPEDAAGSVGFQVLLPPAELLPEGYVLASVELVRVGEEGSLNVYLRRADTDLGAGPIRLHMETAADLPPATTPDAAAVEVRGATGRWSEESQRLEWVEDGVYLSLDAPGWSLEDILGLADVLAPASPATPDATP